MPISAGKRQSVGLADRGARDDLYRQVKFTSHDSDHSQLLKVFLTEKSHVRRKNVKEFRYDRRYTVEMTRAGWTAQAPRDTANMKKQSAYIQIRPWIYPVVTNTVRMLGVNNCVNIGKLD